MKSTKLIKIMLLSISLSTELTYPIFGTRRREAYILGAEGNEKADAAYLLGVEHGTEEAENSQNQDQQDVAVQMVSPDMYNPYQDYDENYADDVDVTIQTLGDGSFLENASPEETAALKAKIMERIKQRNQSQVQTQSFNDYDDEDALSPEDNADDDSANFVILQNVYPKPSTTANQVEIQTLNDGSSTPGTPAPINANLGAEFREKIKDIRTEFKANMSPEEKTALRERIKGIRTEFKANMSPQEKTAFRDQLAQLRSATRNSLPSNPPVGAPTPVSQTQVITQSFNDYDNDYDDQDMLSPEYNADDDSANFVIIQEMDPEVAPAAQVELSTFNDGSSTSAPLNPLQREELRKKLQGLRAQIQATSSKADKAAFRSELKAKLAERPFARKHSQPSTPAGQAPVITQSYAGDDDDVMVQYNPYYPTPSAEAFMITPPQQNYPTLRTEVVTQSFDEDTDNLDYLLDDGSQNADRQNERASLADLVYTQSFQGEEPDYFYERDVLIQSLEEDNDDLQAPGAKDSVIPQDEVTKRLQEAVAVAQQIPAGVPVVDTLSVVQLPVAAAPVQAQPVVQQPIIPTVVHYQAPEPAANGSCVTVVKVYPVFDAVKAGVEQVKIAAMDMWNYLYSFIKKA